MGDEKIKEIPKERIPEQVRDDIRPKKEGRSTFDQYIEQNKILQKSPERVRPELVKGEDQHETRVARQQEEGERSRDRQDEKEQERGKQKAREERTDAAESAQRVVGKGRGRGGSDKGGSGQRFGDGRGYGGTAHKRGIDLLKKGAALKSAQTGLEASKFADRLKSRMADAHLSREFIQNLVSQIVRFVKSGINRDGDKEVRLELNERIFRGLRLRVALKRGKVSVHFNTGNREVRELFASSAENIEKELAAKGILVGEIKVT